MADLDHLKPLGKQYSESKGIPWLWFERMIQQESGWGRNMGPSPAGAAGIAQIVPKWHPGIDPWDHQKALAYAATYLRQMYDRYKSWPRAFAAYNMGPGNTDRWDGTDKGLGQNQETRDYLNIILGPGWASGDYTQPPVKQPGPSPEPGGVFPGIPNLGGLLGLNLGDTVKQAIIRLTTGGRDAIIDRTAGPVVLGLGMGMVTLGVAAAVFKSTPAKIVTQTVATAAPDPRVKAGAAAVRIFQGGATGSGEVQAGQGVRRAQTAARVRFRGAP